MKFFKVTSEKSPSTCLEKFAASTGWLSSFVRRKQFKDIRFSGEWTTADEVESEKYPDMLKEAVEEDNFTPEGFL